MCLLTFMQLMHYDDEVMIESVSNRSTQFETVNDQAIINDIPSSI